jgi:NAD kinase
VVTGFMLQAIKDYMDKKTPFFGLNYGSIGFLMNSVNEEDLAYSIRVISVSSSFTINNDSL